jgi:hypothetical protein
MIRIFTIALLAAAIATPAAADEAKPQCKGSPKVVEKCFTLYGRLAVYNGNPAIRIWPFGTKRMLGVVDTDGDDSTVALPDNIRKALADNPLEINGKYEMCPLDYERPAKMRPVCLESASDLRIVPNTRKN